MQMRAVIVGLVLSALALSARAAPDHYALDPVHTRVMFAVSHAGFSSAMGTVSGSSGEVWFDPDDWASARLRVSVPIARIDLGDGKWNKAALAKNLLDGQDYPQATFVSTRIAPVDASHAAVYGTLTLHGVAREVKLDVTLNAAKRHPMPPFRRTVGFSATTAISRKAFGIDAWPSVIGDRVELRIEAEATHARGKGEPETAADELAASATPDAAPAGSAPTQMDAEGIRSSDAEPTHDASPTDPAEPTP